jgi:hypothetical protein
MAGADVEYETFLIFFNDNGVLRCHGEMITSDPEGSLFAVEGSLESPNQYFWYLHDHATSNTSGIYDGVDHAADVSGTWKCHVTFFENWVEYNPDFQHAELVVQ